MTADLPSILLLGDSLTQLAFEGWGAQLAHVYQRRADVVNRGCSGYNTEFYSRLPLPKLPNVCLVTIFFGANDASLLDENPHHHVSVEDYQRNLSRLIERVRQQYGSTVRILLLTPPPLDHDQRLAYQIQRYGADRATGVLERTTENTRRYAQACQQVAATHNNLPCCDLFHQMLAEPDYGPRFLSDGLHFSQGGHAFVGDAVLRAIREHYPDLAVTPCPATGQWNNSATSCPALDHAAGDDDKPRRFGPYHDEIDHTNVDAAFAAGAEKEGENEKKA